MSDEGDEGVVLRPVGEDDLPVLDRFFTDPAYAAPFQWYGWSNPRAWRRKWEENGLLGDDGGNLSVARGQDGPDGEALGFVSWRRIVAARTSSFWNIGAALLPEARGRGVGTAAHRLLVAYLFAHTLAYRIEADTEVDNIAERRTLEKAGFTQEGVLRGSFFRDGRWRDAVLYSILRDDGAALRS
jgi:RimJ/RimL family protein N-acetyltransferase